MHFSLDSPPPFHVPAQELLQSVVSGLPAWAARPNAECCFSREACVLAVHTFWYCFCGLRQPGSEAEQQALLKMMSQQMARLTLRVAYGTYGKGMKGKDPYALAEGNNPPFKRGAF